MPNDAVFTFSGNDQAKIKVAKALGIKIPEIAMIASRYVVFPFRITCAILEIETSGGENIFGGDDSIWEGHHGKPVTEDAYRHFAIERDHYGKSQGVGPMQLTFPPLQKQADFIGGCYNPMCNVLTGVDFLNGVWTEGDAEGSIENWNSRPEYIEKFMNTLTRWRNELE